MLLKNAHGMGGKKRNAFGIKTPAKETKKKEGICKRNLSVVQA